MKNRYNSTVKVAQHTCALFDGTLSFLKRNVNKSDRNRPSITLNEFFFLFNKNWKHRFSCKQDNLEQKHGIN